MYGTTLQGTITYPTAREKENHRLKSTFGRGYVSSQEGSFHPGNGSTREQLTIPQPNVSQETLVSN